MAGSDFDKTNLTVRQGKVKIELTNTDRNLSGLILHTEELPQELTLEQLPLRLSGIQLLHHPDYKRLFGDRVISERERVKIRAITIRPLAKITRTGKMPIPQEKITLVGWASC
ncbi:hypothetical protein Q5692_37635, partial [Microcoleus sp. C2C3]